MFIIFLCIACYGAINFTCFCHEKIIPIFREARFSDHQLTETTVACEGEGKGKDERARRGRVATLL